MRITDRAPVAPRCLASVVAGVPAEPLREALMAAFVTAEELARTREWHDQLGRPDVEFISITDELIPWTIACPCGSTEGKLLGVRRDDTYVPPIAFACARCNAVTSLFDDTLDGWNAEVSRKRKRRNQPASTFALRCPACKATNWRPAVVVTYQGEHSNVPQGRWQDFFDVLALGGTCVACDAVRLPASFECA